MLGPAAQTRSCRTFSDPPGQVQGPAASRSRTRSYTFPVPQVHVLRPAAARSLIQPHTRSPGSARSRLQPPVVVPPNLSPVPYRHRVVDVEPGDPPGSRSGFTAPACGGEGPAGCQLLRLGLRVTLLSKVTPWLGKLTPRDQEAQGKRACHCGEAGELRCSIFTLELLGLHRSSTLLLPPSASSCSFRRC